MDTIKIEKKNTLMIAHRGLSGLEKENTMPAFVAACNRSYFGTECDIHPTLDGYFVITHDDSLERVANVQIQVENSNLKEIEQIDLIDNFDNKPKSYLKVVELEDYIKCSKKYDKYCIIEFKGEFSFENLIKVIDIVKKHNYLEHVIFISFILSNLIKIREYDKNIKMQYLRSEYKDEYLRECIKYDLGFDVEYSSLTKDVIDAFHKANLCVNAWVVNNKSDAQRLIDWNVDYITTNILE